MSVLPTARKPRVAVTHWIHTEVVTYLESFCEPITNRTRESWPEDLLLHHCQEADGILAFMPDTVDEAFLSHCPNLKIIAGALKGYDNFDIEACSRNGVLFTNVPDLLTAPTAELAVALLLGVARKCVPGDHLIRSGRFEGWRPVLYGSGLVGKTIGLIGLGEVGQALARRLNGFECRLIATEPDIEKFPIAEELGVELRDLDSVTAQSDVVALLLPLNASTRHLVNRSFLRTMKAGSILLNVCRGSVVDEEAVADSLDAGHLGAYAADVFEMEDWALSDRPRSIPSRLLRNREQTFFTPHLGSAVDEVRIAISLEAAAQLKAYFEGKRPQHLLNPSALSWTAAR
ncbi:MAG: NAD(P)-dependent oxidoreductase [Verrucomicrobiota bacterium]